MKRYWFVLLLVLLVPAQLRADEPWKSKSYQQWTQKEVLQVLNNSPWSRQVTVSNTWSAAESDSGPAVRSRVDEFERTGTVSPTAMGGSSRTGATFVVRWVSARTVRQAFARAEMLRGFSEADAEKIAALAPSEYQVAVAGVDMTPFTQADEKLIDELKAKTYLQTKKSKARIAASSVRLQRTPGGRTVVTVFFSFPQKSAAGEPSIPADEKDVEFVCPISKSFIKANFNLSKMTDNQGMDL